MNWTLPPFARAQPIQWNALLLFGSLLLSGLVGGHIVTKNPWFPRITGYLIVGFILGVGGHHASKLAEKIRISGGGRCNFTNVNDGPQNFLSQNPHFCKSALSRYTPRKISSA